MMKRTFFVRAVWDEKANVFYSQSDIQGLHVEAKTIDEFESVFHDLAVELILQNHMSLPDFTEKPLKDLIPAILWERPERGLQVA